MKRHSVRVSPISTTLSGSTYSTILPSFLYSCSLKRDYIQMASTPAPPSTPTQPVPTTPTPLTNVPSVETTEGGIVAPAAGDGAAAGGQVIVGEGGEAITVLPVEGAAEGEQLAEFSEIPITTPAPITEQPIAVEEPVEPPKNPWSHSLFGCFGMDTKLLGLSLCCPCITFGANAELLGEDWMLYCLFCILPGPMCYFGPYIRNKIRTTFEIEGSDTDDVLSYLLCPCLAIVQETQQLKSAGMKPGGDAMNRL
eukprot:sb/3468648/